MKSIYLRHVFIITTIIKALGLFFFRHPKLVYPKKVFLTRSVHGVYAPCVAAALSQDLNGCMKAAGFRCFRLMGDQPSHGIRNIWWCWRHYVGTMGEPKVLWLGPTHTLRSFCTSLRLLHAVSRFYYMRNRKEHSFCHLLFSSWLLIPSLWYTFVQMKNLHRSVYNVRWTLSLRTVAAAYSQSEPP